MFLRLPTFSITIQEVGILHTLVLFPPFRLILGGLLCRCSKGLFGLFLGNLWPIYGLNCECLWYVQMIVLGVVWIKNLNY